METDEERIALFLDYENLAIGAREALGGLTFDLKPVLDALAERGRVIARKAYADWSYFEEDRRMLTRGHVELIEIPQRMGASRKNAADIKMAVDALEMAFEREYITTFVICTGDSDLTPLVHKLRELNKRVIGVGIKDSTSALLPPACDEFLFYDTLEGVDVPAGAGRRKSSSRGGRSSTKKTAAAPPPVEEIEPVDDSTHGDIDELAVRVAQTVSGLRAHLRRCGARLHREARAPAQGPDVQRGRVRVPGVRRAAAAPGRPQRDRAVRGLGQGRSGGLAAGARRRDRGIRGAVARSSPTCRPRTRSPTCRG